MRRFLTAVAVMILLLGAIPLIAQEQTASIEGVVTDQAGAALPGATVDAVSASGQRFSVQSDSTGHYRFPAVPPGTYTLTATLSGMQSATLKNIQIAVGAAKKI